ncbi:MAG: class I SAM-dependent rRNA methyltransferase [Myxococcales bacterium]|nr:class I SAM-dependent rRNA methyltransferase [Myxococcales bacterium]
MQKHVVRLEEDAARRVRLGHPWVTKEMLPRKPGLPGEVVTLLDDEGQFIGRALVDDGQIALRVFSRREQDNYDAAFVTGAVKRAVEMRTALGFLAGASSFRVINGENDGLPGVAVERYGDFLVAQFSSAIAWENRAWLYDALMAHSPCKGIYEQRRFRPLGGEAPNQASADLVRGTAAPIEFLVEEADAKIWVDVTSPLSTGLFNDLRLGRERIAAWSNGRRVLNLFSYTGAISLRAKLAGATEVCAVDVAAKAHARSRRNLEASGLDPEAVEHLTGDAIKELARFAARKREFDLIALDPPSFASKASKDGKPWSAKKDYAELITASLGVLAPGGVLVAVSSTHKMSTSDFEAALAVGGKRAGKQLVIVERVWLPQDFPLLPGFADGNYLKMAICLVR